MVQWASWDVQAGADPEKLQLIEFIAPGINPHAAAWDSGPYSRTILVPAWGAIVVAHRKASDDHIRLYGAPFFYLDFYLQMAHKLGFCAPPSGLVYLPEGCVEYKHARLILPQSLACIQEQDELEVYWAYFILILWCRAGSQRGSKGHRCDGGLERNQDPHSHGLQ